MTEWFQKQVNRGTKPRVVASPDEADLILARGDDPRRLENRCRIHPPVPGPEARRDGEQAPKRLAPANALDCPDGPNSPDCAGEWLVVVHCSARLLSFTSWAEIG